jgi:hypothetical protein
MPARPLMISLQALRDDRIYRKMYSCLHRTVWIYVSTKRSITEDKRGSESRLSLA